MTHGMSPHLRYLGRKDGLVILMLNTRKFAELILKHQPKVLFVAVVDPDASNVLVTELQEGASLYYTKDHLRNFVQVAPALVLSTLEKLKPALGAISTVLIRYEKRILLFSRCQNLIVVLGFGPHIETPFSDSIVTLIRRAAKEAE